MYTYPQVKLGQSFLSDTAYARISSHILYPVCPKCKEEREKDAQKYNI